MSTRLQVRERQQKQLTEKSYVIIGSSPSKAKLLSTYGPAISYVIIGPHAISFGAISTKFDNTTSKKSFETNRPSLFFSFFFYNHGCQG